MNSLVIGDLHEGRKHKATYGDPEIWDRKSLDITHRLIDKHKPDVLILLGDVFNDGKPLSLSFGRLLEVLVRVQSVVIIAGNHDITKITEDLAFSKLSALPGVYTVEHSTTYRSELGSFIGWQATQELYEEAFYHVLSSPNCHTIYTHASSVSFGNENDNVCTEEMIEAAAIRGVKIYSGHTHTASIGPVFSHLGSVVPHSISEVGPRYYLFNGQVMEMPDDGDIILTREEPLSIDPNKVYYVKSGKEVTAEDLKFDNKDLGIDIITDFWEKAGVEGFTKTILEENNA